MKTYLIRAEGTHLVKIGKSRDPNKRLKTLQTGSPHRLVIERVWDSDVEAELHAMWSHRRTQGEWFRARAGEIGLLTIEELDEVRALVEDDAECFGLWLDGFKELLERAERDGVIRRHRPTIGFSHYELVTQ